MVYVDKVHYTKDSYGSELYISEMKWTNSLSENAYNECSKAYSRESTSRLPYSYWNKSFLAYN